jgi:hypothetical protein
MGNQHYFPPENLASISSRSEHDRSDTKKSDLWRDAMWRVRRFGASISNPSPAFAKDVEGNARRLGRRATPGAAYPLPGVRCKVPGRRARCSLR